MKYDRSFKITGRSFCFGFVGFNYLNIYRWILLLNLLSQEKTKAGKKPVITMDKITIPGMGTFSTHLLIDGGRYAGTWSHGKTLGHMWGTIKKTKTEKKK